MSFDPTDSDDQADNTTQDGDFIPPPKAWTPTRLDPFPTFRCTQIKASGEQCENMAIRGMMPENAKCLSHGANNPAVLEKAKSRVDAARMKILNDAESAAEVLSSLTLSGTADNIRLKAATEILDRAGVRGGVEIDVSGEVQVNTADEVKRRLASLALGVIQNDEDLGIEDAIIVGEDEAADE